MLPPPIDDLIIVLPLDTSEELRGMLKGATKNLRILPVVEIDKDSSTLKLAALVAECSPLEFNINALSCGVLVIILENEAMNSTKVK